MTSIVIIIPSCITILIHHLLHQTLDSLEDNHPKPIQSVYWDICHRLLIASLLWQGKNWNK